MGKMTLIQAAVQLWVVCNFMRTRPNYKELEECAQACDLIAMELARLAGTSFDELYVRHPEIGP